jgi:hypothetical protein
VIAIIWLLLVRAGVIKSAKIHEEDSLSRGDEISFPVGYMLLPKRQDLNYSCYAVLINTKYPQPQLVLLMARHQSMQLENKSKEKRPRHSTRSHLLQNKQEQRNKRLKAKISQALSIYSVERFSSFSERRGQSARPSIQMRWWCISSLITRHDLSFVKSHSGGNALVAPLSWTASRARSQLAAPVQEYFLLQRNLAARGGFARGYCAFAGYELALPSGESSLQIE